MRNEEWDSTLYRKELKTLDFQSQHQINDVVQLHLQEIQAHSSQAARHLLVPKNPCTKRASSDRKSRRRSMHRWFFRNILPDIPHDEDEIESREDGGHQVDIFRRALEIIVAPVDWICGRKN